MVGRRWRAGLRAGLRVLRAYRADASTNHDADTMVDDGEDVEAALALALGLAGLVEVHGRSVSAQCVTGRVLLSRS